MIGIVAPFPLLHAQTESDAGNPRQSGEEEIVRLADFHVATESDRGYATTHSIGGTRIATAVSDIPQSIVTLNEQFLTDVNPIEIIDAVKYVSGVNIASAPLNGQMSLRGYNIPGMGFRDGLDDPFGIGGAEMRDMATISRVEIIKGPAGVLYGSHNPGGIINTVTKKPEFRQNTNLRVTMGNFNFQRVDVDTTGPVAGSNRWAYRFIGAHQDAETYFGGNHNRTVAAGTLTFNPSADTSMMVRGEYQYADVATSANAWFADTTGAFSTFIPRKNVTDQRDETREHWNYSYELDIAHRFELGDSSWTVRGNARVNFVDEDKLNYNKVGFRFVTEDGQTIGNIDNTTIAEALAHPDFEEVVADLTRRRDLYEARRRILNVDLVGDFELGPTSHRLITYGQVGDSRTDGLKRTLADYPSMSTANPQFFQNPIAMQSNLRLVNDNFSSSRNWAWGIQNQMRVLEDRIVTSFGTRYSKSTPRFSQNRITGAITTGDPGSDWVYRFGIVGKPMSGVSVFYNFSQTFNPISGTSPEGVPWKNQTGEIHEGGVKFEMFDHRLAATMSYFDVTLNNFIVTVVFGEPRQEAQNETKGVELDLAWQVTDNLTFMAAIGHMDSVNQNGIRMRGVSQGINYRFFGRYSFTEGPLEGLSAGLGHEYTNDRAGDAADTFNLPPFRIWDAFVGYRRDNWNIQLNVKNLADRTYPASSVARPFVWVGEPRRFTGSVSYSF